MVVKGEGRIGNLGLADEIYFYIKWINIEVLQHGTGTSTNQFPIPQK